MIFLNVIIIDFCFNCGFNFINQFAESQLIQ